MSVAVFRDAVKMRRMIVESVGDLRKTDGANIGEKVR